MKMGGEVLEGFWRRRCLVRFRKVPVRRPCEVREGFWCRDFVRVWRVLAEKMLGEVPEGSGAGIL